MVRPENRCQQLFDIIRQTIENTPCFHVKTGFFSEKSRFFKENRIFFRFSA